MSALLLIGFCHLGVVWHGDILILYSLLGMLLPFFIHCSNRKLLISAGILLTVPLAIHWIAYITSPSEFWYSLRNVALSFKKSMGYEATELLAMRTSSNPVDVFIANIYSSIPRPMSYLITGRPFQVLAQFLLGIYLMRKLLAGDKLEGLICTKSLILLFIAGLGLNFIYAQIKALSGSPFSLTPQGLFQGVCYHLGAIILALGYLALLLRLSQNTLHRVLNWLTYLGKMSLTIYLMQTSLCVLIFYGYGLGLMRQVPFWSIGVFGVLILTCQYLFSRFWLQHFKQGPIEALWRKSVEPFNELPVKKHFQN